MTKTILALLVGLMLAAPAVAAEEAGITWYDDFDKAVAAAKAEGKDLLVDFTGSDWCGWCVRLHKEVFAHDEFNQGVKDKYVLVALDFPRGDEAKAKVPNPTRNDELMKKYGIRGFPSILLMNADGDVYARTGYQRGGPAAYLKHLETISAAGKKGIEDAKALVKAYEEAADADKAAAIEKAIDALAAMQPGAPGSSTLVPVAKAGIDADPENKAGLRLKAVEALMAGGHADADVYAAAEALDAKNEKGLLERVLLTKFQTTRADDKDALKALLAQVEAFEKLGADKDERLCTQLYVNTAWCYHQHLKDNKKAARFAKKLQKMGADANPQLKGLIEKILAAAEAEGKPADEPTGEKPAEEKSAE